MEECGGDGRRESGVGEGGLWCGGDGGFGGEVEGGEEEEEEDGEVDAVGGGFVENGVEEDELGSGGFGVHGE